MGYTLTGTKVKKQMKKQFRLAVIFGLFAIALYTLGAVFFALHAPNTTSLPLLIAGGVATAQVVDKLWNALDLKRDLKFA
jgi:putative Mn2+ efflux pump MntP